MLTIRKEQMAELREHADQEVLSRAAAKIYQTIRDVEGPRLSSYPAEAATRIITEVIQACREFDITDFEDLCIWSYLRLETREEFYRSSAFKIYLDDPLIHPKAKARNVVTAMQLASEGRR